MDTLLNVLDETTALTTDVDLFAYEIPLKKIGVWLSDARVDSRFNGTGVQEFDIYYRGKTKQSAISNVKYLKDTIDSLSGSDGTCQLLDGTTFNIKMLYQWEYLEKDSEGYYVFTNMIRLLADYPVTPVTQDIDGGTSSSVSSQTLDGGESNSTFNDQINGGDSNGN